MIALTVGEKHRKELDLIPSGTSFPDFQAALIIYDLGILGDDKELANSLWRRFFLLADRPDPTKIELLVRYVRQTMAALDRVSLDTLLTVDETFAYNLWQPLLPDDLNQGPTLSKIS